MQYSFNYEPEMYKYILSTNILNRKKHEDKIFKALVRGYSAKEISKRYHYCESTIWNRRRDIYKKTKKYMKEYITNEQKLKILQNKMFKIYLLSFPNGKIYIGMSSDVEKRWDKGNGYQENKEMFEDIINFGWNNIKKEFLYENLSYEQAIKKEKEMIKQYKSNKKNIGYNKKI